MSGIIAKGVKPTLSELEKFEEALDDDDIELNGAPMTGASAGKRNQTVTYTFSTGDNVEVCEGELMGMPKHKDLKEIVEFQASELKKYFTVGADVKVRIYC